MSVHNSENNLGEIKQSIENIVINKILSDEITENMNPYADDNNSIHDNL